MIKYEVFLEKPNGEKEHLGTTPYLTLVKSEIDVLKQREAKKPIPKEQSKGFKGVIEQLLPDSPSLVKDLADLLHDQATNEINTQLWELARETEIPLGAIEQTEQLAHMAFEKSTQIPKSRVIFEIAKQ